jgi:hypothetical protein
VGALDLTALGTGAVIGTGIFVIIGEAISDSGPAIVLAFVLAGVTCVFSALSYAELASSLPVSGSAYLRLGHERRGRPEQPGRNASVPHWSLSRAFRDVQVLWVFRRARRRPTRPPESALREAMGAR